MNRRMFLQSSSAAVSLAFLSPLIGCPTTTIADFVKLIATDAATLATYFGQSSLAGQITSLASQIAVDITNWKSGTSAADAIAAINDLIGLINLIPIATPYAPLIVLILSALTGLLALLPNSVPAMTKATRDAINKHNITPTHYNGSDKKSMTDGKNNFDHQWSTIITLNHLTLAGTASK
jgi:hypothetical protein